MQTIIFTRALTFATAAILFASSCRKTEITPQQPEAIKQSSALQYSNNLKRLSEECDPSPYVVTLDKKPNNNVTWTWTWTVRNPTPGNGNGITLQDLSHWGFTFPNCTGAPTINDIVSAAYSSDSSNWTYFTPTYQPDPSISGDGISDSVLKFNLGTSGYAKSYYRLVVAKDFVIDADGCGAGAYFKSGSKTGVKRGYFPSMGCGGESND